MQHCKKQYYQVALPGGHLVVEGCWRVLCCSLYVSELFLPSLSKKKLLSLPLVSLSFFRTLVTQRILVQLQLYAGLDKNDACEQAVVYLEEWSQRTAASGGGGGTGMNASDTNSTCNGKSDPPKCSTELAENCTNAVVLKECPVMCDTCVVDASTTGTTTAASSSPPSTASSSSPSSSTPSSATTMDNGDDDDENDGDNDTF